MGKRLSPHRPIDWDDFRFVLSLADSGSLTQAASALRVNRTTVLRRINAFERNHGVRLFERLPTGYMLTEAGHELLAAARGFESSLLQIERRLSPEAEKDRSSAIARLRRS